MKAQVGSILIVAAALASPLEAALLFTFMPTPDGLGTILEAEGTVDITGRQKVGSHGIPHARLTHEADYEAFQMVWASNAGDSYAIGTASPLYNTPTEFNYHITLSSTVATGDSMGLFVTQNPDRTALLVPRDFTSGPISGRVVFPDIPLATLSVIEQSFAWGPGLDQQVSVVAIPEPTTCTLALAALCLVVGRERR